MSRLLKTTYSCEYVCSLFLIIADPKDSKPLLLTVGKNAQHYALPDTAVASPHLLYSHSFSIQTPHVTQFNCGGRVPRTRRMKTEWAKVHIQAYTHIQMWHVLTNFYNLLFIIWSHPWYPAPLWKILSVYCSMHTAVFFTKIRQQMPERDFVLITHWGNN